MNLDLSIRREVRPAVVFLVALTLLTGGLYPIAVTVAARLLFPSQAQGSPVRRGDVVVGSALVGQEYDGDVWFHGRPSATSGHPYNPLPSMGSNQGPLHPDLAAAFTARATALRAGSTDGALLPADLLTASASGLDPDVSPAAARLQVERVAHARGLDRAAVAALVERHILWRQLGVLGEPRVNLLRLNLALDSLARATSW